MITIMGPISFMSAWDEGDCTGIKQTAAKEL
jgi:hypothetical protein